MRSILDRVSYHAVYDPSILDALRFAQSHGFAGVQLAIEAPHLSFETLTHDDYAAIAAFCEANRMRISLHGPDVAASLFEASRYLQDGTFRYLAAMFDAAERMAVTLVTLHLGNMPSFGTSPRPGRTLPECDLAPYRRALDANLRRLVSLAAGRFDVCVENFRLNAMAIEVLEPYLDADELALCWDLPKGLGDERVQRFYYWEHLAHVRQVHLHDVRDGLSHEVLGTGTLDLMRFLPRLAEADVRDYCIEVRPRDKAVAGRDHLRRLIERASPDPTTTRS